MQAFAGQWVSCHKPTHREKGLSTEMLNTDLKEKCLMRTKVKKEKFHESLRIVCRRSDNDLRHDEVQWLLPVKSRTSKLPRRVLCDLSVVDGMVIFLPQRYD